MNFRDPDSALANTSNAVRVVIMNRVFLLLASLSIAAFQAQAADPPPSSDNQALISEQFGSQFVLVQNFPVLTGDFNGDGSEDAVFVATSKSGLQIDSGTRFRVTDPSSEYFGLGDPRITSQFASQYPGGPRYLLIIHGNGKEGWHAKEPKGRFVLINVAFDRISLSHVAKKKKVFDDISVEETGILSSFLYWDGHKYKWQPGASEL